ncbi:MAG TPA: NAD(P)-dependent oxidoreductase [Holophagaceae bacterium]|nr:NAD(P)-dependent oxidoreductase [Holophagaceae bacterium]
MRILVVGATGFIGSHLVRCLASLGHELEGWGRRSAAPDFIHRYRSLDLTGPSAFEDLDGEWDAAYLLSAHSIPGAKWTSEMVLQNLAMTGRFLEAINGACPGCRIIIGSSALVYGPAGHRLTENDPRNPGSMYGLSKAMTEDWALFAARSMDIQIARIFNQVGAGMQKGLLAMDTLEKIRSEEEAVSFSGSDTTRDYLDVRDGVEALARLADIQAASGSIWNICSGEGHSVSDLGRILMDEIQVEKPLRFLHGNPDRLVGDPSKLREATGWVPRHSLRDALGRLVDSTR